jgi:hypothetical protein
VPLLLVLGEGGFVEGLKIAKADGAVENGHNLLGALEIASQKKLDAKLLAGKIRHDAEELRFRFACDAASLKTIAEELEEILLDTGDRDNYNQSSVFRYLVTENKKLHNPSYSKVFYVSPIPFDINEILCALNNIRNETVNSKASDRYMINDGSYTLNNGSTEATSGIEFNEQQRIEKYFKNEYKFFPTKNQNITKGDYADGRLEALSDNKAIKPRAAAVGALNRVLVGESPLKIVQSFGATPAFRVDLTGHLVPAHCFLDLVLISVDVSQQAVDCAVLRILLQNFSALVYRALVVASDTLKIGVCYETLSLRARGTCLPIDLHDALATLTAEDRFAADFRFTFST